MNILVLGGDGYLGWPTAMHFAMKGHEVTVVDNGNKRRWEEEVDAGPLWMVPTLKHRARLFAQVTGKKIKVYGGDVANLTLMEEVFTTAKPDAVIHYAEQPSAPYSMKGPLKAMETMQNNICGTTCLLWVMKKHAPDCHLIKLGTMGEYGTPNVVIEEGWLELEHKGRKDRVLYPKKPGSIYHVSKVADSQLIEFHCRAWGIRATDLNQGVVYGIDTPETALHDDLRTSFHYDAVFGTVINRFVVQAVMGVPLTVYGKGGQTRGYLNINDTLACVELAALNPAKRGEFRVFNQMTETFSINQLAQRVMEVGRAQGLGVSIEHIKNPRVEQEEHFYEVVHTGLTALGLTPNLLTDDVLARMLRRVRESRESIDQEIIFPKINW